MSKRIAQLALSLVVTLSAWASGGWALANDGLTAREAVVALRGARIESCGKQGQIENGVIVFKGSKIQAVGKDVEIPDNALVIDARSKTVLPGIVDPYHVVSVASGPAATSQTITVGGRSFNVRSTGSSGAASFTRIADGFDPFDANFRPLARSGITNANLVARGYGQSAHARMTIGHPLQLIANGEGLVYVSVSNDTGSLGVLRAGLAAGSTSSSSSSSSSARGSSSSGIGTSSRTASRSSGRLSPVEQTLWKDILAGKRPLLVNASNSAAILHVLKALQPHDKVNLLLIANGPNVFETLDQLKGRRLSLILSPTIDLAPNSQNRICVPRLVHEAGIEFAISLSVSQSSLANSQDAPLVPIAFLAKAGLPRDVALAALSTTPARLLGVAETHGSIEPGKLANLLVFDGDPLDPASRLEQVIVEGRTVHED